MKYSICIVGHGNFPDGVKSAIDILVGDNGDVTCFNLNSEMTHDQFKIKMGQYLTEHQKTIVFADMTGGAPYQIVAQIILESGHPDQYIISSISMNAILDLYLKNSMAQLNANNIEKSIQHVIHESRHLMKLTPDNTVEVSDDATEEGSI